jgi:hypothetical protein
MQTEYYLQFHIILCDLGKEAHYFCESNGVGKRNIVSSGFPDQFIFSLGCPLSVYPIDLCKNEFLVAHCHLLVRTCSPQTHILTCDPVCFVLDELCNRLSIHSVQS